MPRDQWKLPFLQLQQSLKPLVAVNLELFHSNVLLPFHGREKAMEFADDLEAAQMAEELVSVVETPTTGCKFHGHFFFGDKRVVGQLEFLLSDLHTWVDDMPDGILPKFDIPRTDYQNKNNLALWANILLVLGWSQDKWHFAADVEYQQKIDRIGCCLWEELHRPPHLEPMMVLAHQKEISLPFEKWPRLFAEQGFVLPDYFGAYLRDAGNMMCGDFLKASLSAIDIIVFMLEGQTKGPSTQTRRSSGQAKSDHIVQPKKRSHRAKPRDGEPFSDDARVLLMWLLEHHGCTSGKRNFGPYENQGIIAKQLSDRGTSFTQSRVSNSLKELMSGVKLLGQLEGDEKYRMLCEEGEIIGVLNALNLKENRDLARTFRNAMEKGDDDMERHADRGY